MRVSRQIIISRRFQTCAPLYFSLTNLSLTRNYISFAEGNSGNIHIVGNKGKGRISKRGFQKNKARQISEKRTFLTPLIRTRTCAYQGVRNVSVSENFAYVLNE